MTTLTLKMDHMNMTVKNLVESLHWYKRVFGFERVESGVQYGTPWAIIRKDDALLCLYEHKDREFLDGDELKVRKLHGFNHFSIRVNDRDAWKETVKRENIPVALEWRYPHSDSWYINDPTGYEIEVVHWDEDRVQF